MNNLQLLRFEKLRKDILMGFLENIKVNKQIHETFKGHPVLRRTAIESQHVIKWDQESMIEFAKLKPIQPCVKSPNLTQTPEILK